MVRVLILAEGQTEERFIKDVLAPHLHAMNIFVTAIIVRTKEPPAGSPYKGGFSSYHKIRGDVFRLLQDTDAIVTSMFDFYGLPADFPGVATVNPLAAKHERAKSVQLAFDTNVDHQRFRSFITLHEFETLVFASSDSLGEQFSDPQLTDWCTKVVGDSGGAELINDGQTTHPHERLRQKIESYRKVGDGPSIVAKQGLLSVRQQCPHFNEWLEWLENLAGGSP
jgi:Domain of unknown function (DUF4276)